MSVNYMISNIYATIAGVLFSNIVVLFMSFDVKFLLCEISTWEKNGQGAPASQPHR